MRLVDYDGKSLTRLRSNLIKDERKFLHRRNDNLSTLLDELAKITRMLRVANGRAHLHELLLEARLLVLRDP
jgi:hypothetical protein